MQKIVFLFLPVLLFISAGFIIKNDGVVVNYLNTPEVFKYDKLEYKLAWSSHPDSNYFMQEYIPAKETLDNFKHMITIDYLLIDTPAKNIVALKVNALIEREKSDIVAHHVVQMNEAKKEYLLDFILSSGNGQTVNTVEFNTYRYRNYTDKGGHKGVLLFAISKRAYDDDITGFLRNLRDERPKTLKSFSEYNFPDVLIN